MRPFKTILSSSLLFALTLSFAQAQTDFRALYPKFKTVSLVNPLPIARSDALVCIDLEQLQFKQPENYSFIVLRDGQEIPSQKLGLKLYCVTDLAPSAQQKIELRYVKQANLNRNYPQRAHAELSPKRGGYFQDKKYVGGDFVSVLYEEVPQEHIDHDTYYRYEGPGWESDLVGYRFYLDWRNRIDIFGKKVRQMVLPGVGLDGFDSYHTMADWGMDIFKVGESMGIGSLALWRGGKLYFVSQVEKITCRINADGPVLAQIRTDYQGWQAADQKRDLKSFLTIAAGSRLTAHKIQLNSSADTLATGLAKTAGCLFLQSEPNTDGWHYIALWGLQSLAGDNLGTAIFFRKADLVRLTEDELNYLVLLKLTNNNLKYYFAAAWEQEPDGIKDAAAFEKYLNLTRQLLNNPVQVKF